MKFPCHVTLDDGIARRVEVEATSRTAAIAAALRAVGATRGRVTVREPHTDAVLAMLAAQRDTFPIITARI